MTSFLLVFLARFLLPLTAASNGGGIGISPVVLLFLIVIVLSVFIGIFGVWRRDIFPPYGWGIFFILFAFMNLALLLWHNGG